MPTKRSWPDAAERSALVVDPQIICAGVAVARNAPDAQFQIIEEAISAANQRERTRRKALEPDLPERYAKWREQLGRREQTAV
jgi:hypothetical protein